MAVNNSLAEVIKNAREINGYSQRQLAKELNISNSELSRIESGSRQKPDTEILTKIANILGLSLRDLLKLAGYDELALTFGKNKIDTKSVIDYKKEIKEYERFYFDILDDSYKKKEIVRKQRDKLRKVLEKYELSQLTPLHKEPSYEELIHTMKEVLENLEPSAKKFDYKKLPKVN